MRVRKLLVLAAFLMVALPVSAATATRTSAFEYDAASGLLVKEIIEPDNPNLCLATTYSYDAYGNKTAATTSNCAGASGDALIETRTAASTFDAQGRFPTTSANALGHSESKSYDARFGTVVSLTGPNGLTTTWAYDDLGRKVSESRADGTTSTWTYTLCGVCPANGAYFVTQTATASPVAKIYYDKLNREIRNETQGFDGTAVFKDTEYDALGRIARVSKPYYAGQPVLWTTFAYDLLGRVIAETQPATASGIVKTATAYNGLTTTVTVSNNDSGTNLPEGVTQTKTTVRNSQGQTVSVTDAQGNGITYAYDPFGNLLSTNAGGVITALTYDLRGRKLAMTDPDMGAWSYAYDALSQLKRQTDAKGQVTTMAYDRLGRMVNRSEPDLISNWTYDACVKGVGKLCQASSDNGYSRTLTYDALGRVASIATFIDTTYTVNYGYDANGRLAQTTYPTGFVTQNVYTSLGYLQKVTDAAGTLVYWQANTVSAAGSVLTETLGNGLTTTRGYDALERMTSNVVAGGAGTLQQFSYAYDTLGNMTQRLDVVQANLTESFVYDKLNRLLQASGPGMTTRSMSYNALGNITYKSDAGTYAYPAIGTARPHAVSSIAGTVNGVANPAFSYDANGNLTAGLNRTLTYTSFNLPATVSAPNAMLPGTNVTYQYTYNAEHERVRHIITRADGVFTTFYLHPAGRGQLLYEKEVKPNVTEHKHYLTAGSLLIGVYISRSDTTTETRYFHHDHLGSLTLITNAAGGQIERLAFEAFGKRRFANGTDDPGNTLFGITTDRGFTSHEHLDEIALIHMNGRVYDPLLARFMTADPQVQFAGNLQSYNRYSYVNNNPLAYIDPSGYGLFSSIGHALSSAWKSVWHSGIGRAAVIVGIAWAGGWAITNWLGATAGSTGASAFGAWTLTASNTAVFELSTLGAATVGAGTGFTVGVASGGDLESGLRGAASGALLGGVDGYFGNTWSLERVAAKSFGGGIVARLQGGRFEDGFLSAGVTSGTRYLYNTLVGRDVNAAPGENRPGPTNYEPDRSPDNFGRLARQDIGRNIIGFNEDYEGQGCFFCRDAFRQGGPVSRALNIAPGVNAIGGLDDFLNNRAPTSLGESQWFKGLTIPTSVFVTVPALLDRVPLYRPQDPFGRRR